MKRLDDGKVSLVEFLQSIKFAQQSQPLSTPNYGSTRFAHFYPQARSASNATGEESQLIRSAN